MLYAPALALSAVTGLHFEGAVIGIGDNVMNSVIIMSIYVELNEKPAFEKDSSADLHILFALMIMMIMMMIQNLQNAFEKGWFAHSTQPLVG